jgi:hypothetical protein
VESSIISPPPEELAHMSAKARKVLGVNDKKSEKIKSRGMFPSDSTDIKEVIDIIHPDLDDEDDVVMVGGDEDVTSLEKSSRDRKGKSKVSQVQFSSPRSKR